MHFFHIACICSAVMGYGAASGKEIELSAQEMESAKAAILAWSTSLHSFSGSYRIEKSQTQDPDSEPFIMDMTYRYQGNNRLLTHDMRDSEGNHVVHTDALWDGKVTAMHSINDQSTSGQLDLNANVWIIPPGSFISPEMLFGAICNETPLITFLASGKSTLLVRNGVKIFRHLSDDYILEIWLDENYRILRYDTAYWSFTEKEIAEHWPGNLYEVRHPLETLELGLYMDINGVPFPTSAILTVWTWDKAQFDAIKAKREAEGWDTWSDIDYHVRVCTQVESIPNYYQKFTLDVSTVLVNPELTQADFSIDFPENTTIWDGSGNKIERRFFHTYAWSLSTGLGLFAALIALSIGIWRWKVRH